MFPVHFRSLPVMMWCNPQMDATNVFSGSRNPLVLLLAGYGPLQAEIWSLPAYFRSFPVADLKYRCSGKKKTRLLVRRPLETLFP
jgi:hypothetical protein